MGVPSSELSRSAAEMQNCPKVIFPYDYAAKLNHSSFIPRSHHDVPVEIRAHRHCQISTKFPSLEALPVRVLR